LNYARRRLRLYVILTTCQPCHSKVSFFHPQPDGFLFSLQICLVLLTFSI